MNLLQNGQIQQNLTHGHLERLSERLINWLHQGVAEANPAEKNTPLATMVTKPYLITLPIAHPTALLNT